REWQDATALVTVMKRLDDTGSQIHLVNCVDSMHQNLAITALRPSRGTRAAGVPLLVDVTVQNFGPAAARAVSVSLEEDGHARPAIVLEELAPGKEVTRRFPVLFATAGEHEVSARLESDAVAADDSRSLVVDLAKVVDVLVIDGDARGQD